MKKKCDNLGVLPPPPPRRELCDNPVKLCHDITRLSRAKAREVGFEGVMSQPGARLVLSFLAIGDGVSQRELVAETHLRPPTVSVIIGKMEEEGMVERRRNPADRRETVIHLTDYGREVDRRGIESIKSADAAALTDLAEDEINTLMHLLGKMRNNLIASVNDGKKESEDGK